MTGSPLRMPNGGKIFQRMGENVTNDDADRQLALDWRIAICLGLDMTQQETAEAVGVSRATVYSHLATNTRFFDYATACVRTINAMRVSKSVTQVTDRAEMRIKKLFDRAFIVTERLVAKAEKMGDEITWEKAMEFHKALTIWASKFSASEAPKRLDLTSTHTDVLKIDDETFERLNSFMATHSRLLPQPNQQITGEVVDAEVIPQ